MSHPPQPVDPVADVIAFVRERDVACPNCGYNLRNLTRPDDGPGMVKTAREGLFKAFAGSARKGGTGLGLVIVRDVMRAHGGEIELLSSDDTGTIFRLRLPRAD